jgi:hypothetical protein
LQFDWALLIGVDQYSDTKLPEIRFASSDVAQIAATLIASGMNAKQVTTIFGNQATKSRVESQLRKLQKSWPAEARILFVFVGIASRQDGLNSLILADTDPEDLEFTTLGWQVIQKALGERSYLAILEGSPSEAKGLQSLGFDVVEFEELRSNQAILLANQSGQLSFPLEPLQQRAFGSLLVQAINSQVEATLSLHELQTQIDDGLPRLLRKHLSEPSEQQTLLVGNRNLAIRSIDPNLKAKLPTLSENTVRRMVLSGRDQMKVKSLAGFQKGYSIPEQANTSAKRFVVRIAEADLRQEIEGIYHRLQEQFKFKRKDLEARVETDGFGFIRTPHFDYGVQIELSVEDPAWVTITRSITRIVQIELVQSPAFSICFGPIFDRLQIDFVKPVDVESFLDALEEHPIPGMHLRSGIDSQSVELTLDGFVGTLKIVPEGLQLTGPSAGPSSLLSLLIGFISRLGANREVLMLE